MPKQPRDDNVQLLFQLGLDRLDNRFSFKEEMSGGKGGSITCIYSDEHTKRPVVVKILITPTEDKLRRFDFEANVLSEFREAESVFSHRPVIGLTPVKKIPALPVHYFVMEYADGISLHDYLQSKGFPQEELPWEVSVEIAQRVSLALSIAARFGVVHRDLHDRNIMIADHDPGARAGHIVSQTRIIDFGCGRVDPHLRKFAHDWWAETHNLSFLLHAGVLYDPRAFRPSGHGARDHAYTRRPLGAWSVVAPEVLADPQSATHKADIWSLGALFYYMLTRRFPFQDDHLKSLLNKMDQRQYEPVHEARKDLPRIFSDVVDLFLEPDPKRRIDYLWIGYILVDLLEVAVDFWELHPDFTREYIKHRGEVRTCSHCQQWSFTPDKCQHCGARFFDDEESYFDWAYHPLSGPGRIWTVRNADNLMPN